VVGPAAPAAKLELLAQLPEVEVLTLPAPAGKLDLGKLLDILGERKLTSLLVEGGSQVHGSFVDAGLVDRIYAFIAPKVVGGAAALTPIGGTGLAAMLPGLPVAVDATKVLGKDFLLTGRVTAGEV
jgi:diaminohydroxyphosphoribosylaminopyrimidine deaminase/5-amino-6-(5-phosphoribosylamino)uracil reductase